MTLAGSHSKKMIEPELFQSFHLQKRFHSKDNVYHDLQGKLRDELISMGRKDQYKQNCKGCMACLGSWK